VIAAHRRFHRGLQWILWPLVVLVFSVALASRRPDPRIAPWPDWLTASVAKPAEPLRPSSPADARVGVLLDSSEDAFGTWPARLSRWSGRRIEITPLRPLDRPELLVYWIPGEIEAGALPDDAHLIGRLASSRPHRFALPDAAAPKGGTFGAGGQILIYSLGHQEIVATARLADLASGAAP
jgi:hypothetical protein